MMYTVSAIIVIFLVYNVYAFWWDLKYQAKVKHKKAMEENARKVKKEREDEEYKEKQRRERQRQRNTFKTKKQGTWSSEIPKPTPTQETYMDVEDYSRNTTTYGDGYSSAGGMFFDKEDWNKRVPEPEKEREIFSATNTKEQNKRIYHKLAKRYHPDRGGDPVRFRKLQQMYERYR